jgi:hypothetical protein
VTTRNRPLKVPAASVHSAVSSLEPCPTPARMRRRALMGCGQGQASNNADMTFHVNRNVGCPALSYPNEFPEGGIAVNLDGGSC